MIEHYEYIERYYEGQLTGEEIAEFERKIIEDPLFAEEMAFYTTLMRVARNQAGEEKKSRFREIYNETVISDKKTLITNWWPYISAAAVIAGIFITIYLFVPSSSPDKLADRYIEQHFQSLSTIMDNREDSMKVAGNLYNEGKYPEALNYFEAIIIHDSLNFKAKEYAGIVSLRLRQYDKSLHYFQDLENYRGLHANPGKFYRGLTLLKRNLPGDKALAKKILEEVVNDKLDHNKEARELLNKL